MKTEQGRSLEIARDYLAKDRTVLANERTLLAYMRTALMFFGTGVTFIKILNDDQLLVIIGWAMILVTPILIALAVSRHRKVSKHLESDYDHN